MHTRGRHSGGVTPTGVVRWHGACGHMWARHGDAATEAQPTATTEREFHGSRDVIF